MRERTIYIDGNDIREQYGLVYSSFSEKVPEPKVTKVEIPAGSDLDISEAVGFMAYHNGEHEFKFLLYGNTQPERLAQLKDLLGDIHGKYHEYVLSWDSDYIYKGRWKVTVDHKFDNADVVTMTVDRYPWRLGVPSESIDINSHPTATVTLMGSTYYDDLNLTTLQTGVKSKVGLAAEVTHGAAGTYHLMDTLYGDNPVTVTVTDWWQYLDGTNLVVNTAKGYSLSGTNAVFGSDWSKVGTDLYCANEATQHSTLVYTRRDL